MKQTQNLKRPFHEFWDLTEEIEEQTLNDKDFTFIKKLQGGAKYLGMDYNRYTEGCLELKKRGLA